jgi:hypothetical protein
MNVASLWERLRSAEREAGELGELLEQHEGAGELDLSSYPDDPVGFIRDVIGDQPWSRQEDVAEAVRDEPLVTVRSANGTGKDWLAARLALWWVYARNGLVVLTGPTEAQVSEILMRKEVASAFRRARDLPGSLHVHALRPEAGGRAGILAKTATEVSGLTGLHDRAVLFCISEAQADGVEVAFDAAFANAVGEEDRILAYGNPLSPAGPFYRSHLPTSDWRKIRIPASDVPNVREGETVVPGLMTRQGVDRIAAEYGEESGYYTARILADFPEEADEGMFRREWLDAAAELYNTRKLQQENYESREQAVLAVDVARRGADQTVVAIRRGDVLERFETWRNADTEETANRVNRMAVDMGPVAPMKPDTPDVRKIVVDAVGIGAGVFDKLDATPSSWSVKEHKGSRKAKDEERFRNRRAEAFWALRKKLERGELALPDDEELFEELLAIRWRADGQDRVQMESKRDMKSRLGRSPDRADALAMAFGRGGRSRVTRTLTWG